MMWGPPVVMLQGLYLTVTKSCKYCGALETRLPLSQLLALFWEMAPGLGTLSPTLFAWADPQRCFGLVDLWLWAWLVQLLGVICWTGCVGVAQQGWFHQSEEVVPWTGEGATISPVQFAIFSPDFTRSNVDLFFNTCLEPFFSLSPSLGATRTISPDCKGGSSLLVWL